MRAAESQGPENLGLGTKVAERRYPAPKRKKVKWAGGAHLTESQAFGCAVNYSSKLSGNRSSEEVAVGFHGADKRRDIEKFDGENRPGSKSGVTAFRSHF